MVNEKELVRLGAEARLKDLKAEIPLLEKLVARMEKAPYALPEKRRSRKPRRKMSKAQRAHLSKVAKANWKKRRLELKSKS